MLTKLSIQNYVIINEIVIRFPQGLTVITGETGAGKSIIIGALGLILGERADATALLNREKKCVIEGHFDAAGKKNVRRFLREHDLDESPELLLRREVSANGKSRAFINDTPVNLSQLQELSSCLVDLHQQFDTMELANRDFQRDVLDALAGQLPLLNEYALLHSNWKSLEQETRSLKQQQLQWEKEADYNRFQFSELEEAAFRDNELEETEVELRTLSHAEGIRAALDKVYHGLQESDTPVVQQLKVMLHQLQPFAAMLSSLPALIQRLQSAQIELQDIAGDMDRVSQQVSYDPQKAGWLNERLSLGYKLQKKHGVSTTRELLEIQRLLGEKLQAVQDMGEMISRKETETADAFAAALQMADTISAGRKKQVQPLEEKVNRLLAQVGMPNARLKVEINPDITLNAFGKDQVQFLFDANKSGQFAPVHKVASGGELSRLMLCIKSLVARSLDLPTLIFDEIDTGISGEAARQVGIIMKGLAGSRQLICITHQPQIAGKADTHFFVHKQIVRDQVQTRIRELNIEERITTIAQMLSGEKPTAAALENAREMVMN